jgi:hypothetical protein
MAQRGPNRDNLWEYPHNEHAYDEREGLFLLHRVKEAYLWDVEIDDFWIQGSAALSEIYVGFKVTHENRRTTET